MYGALGFIPISSTVSLWMQDKSMNITRQFHRLSNLNSILIHIWKNTLMEMYDPCFASYMIYDDWWWRKMIDSIAFQDQSKSLGLINSSPKSGAWRTSLFGFPNILTVGFIEKREKAEIRNMGRNWKDGGGANEDNLITLSAPFHSERHSTVQKFGFVHLLRHIDNISVRDMQSPILGMISL